MATSTATPPSKLLSAWAPRSDVERLEALAREHDRSTSAELRRALREYLRRAEPTEPEETR